MEKLLYGEVYLICILLIGLLLFWMTRRETRSSVERWMIAILVCFLCSFSANLLFTAAQSLLRGTALLVPASYALKSVYFAAMDVGVFAWCVYGETELKSGSKRKKKNDLLLLLPLLIPLVGVCSNLFTQHMFHITETGEYFRKRLFHLHMLYLTLWSGVFSARLLYFTKFELDPIKKAHLRKTALFPLCILAAWLLSFAGERIPVICVAITFALLSMYYGITNQQVSKDMLTQVNNRQNLISFLNYRISFHEEKVYLLMIDIDYFKTINDTYGHLEGDRALVFVASVLKNACMEYKKRPYIARYGGDEFMVVLEGTRQDAAGLVENIRSMLRESKMEDCPYDVTLSIGMAEYQVGMDAKQLIAVADEQMYKIKQARR